MDGILNLNKPPGISSARAVSDVKRLLPRGTKIGHAGTLDPFARGVLLLLVGRATKSCEQLMDQPKQYVATILFGSTTETDDCESPRIPWPTVAPGTAPPTNAQIDVTLTAFKGQIKQQPPAYSALHVGGVRAYQLARRGTLPELKPRHVMVYDIQRIDFSWPELILRVDCGRGTYIRALARDIGVALNVGGHLTELWRTRIGPFALEKAKTLNELTRQNVAQCLTWPLDFDAAASPQQRD